VRYWNPLPLGRGGCQDALLSAGADEEKARKAAEAIAEHEKRFDHIDNELLLLKWMMGVMLAGVISLVLKAFFIT